jgi:predicted Rossmann fold flavoprotein
MSGPAILRLSSYAARHLAEATYRAVVVVNWCGEQGEQAVREHLEQLFSINPHKTVANVWLPWLTQRHWHELLRRASVPATQRCDAINPTLLRRLLSVLTSDHYPVTGRGAYKEEFVTCGGVALSNLSPKTLESKSHPGLYFAGEVLDVDGITGGFNLQAAWSMGYVVAENIAESGGNNCEL